MNSDLNLLQPYPFEKLAQLFASVEPPLCERISLSIGEPQHPSPDFVLAELVSKGALYNKYPTTKGPLTLRTSISQWACRRFGLTALCPEQQVLPVNGTREAIFSFVQACFDQSQRAHKPLVVSPNPFYQIYEGATLLAGGQLHLLPCDPETGLQPDYQQVPDHVWEQTQILFICSPNNPTGAVLSLAQLQALLLLADRHRFVIAADECYSEIYQNEHQPPIGLLEACARLGRDDYRQCLVFHSLSKRSNLPGLRSGFVAGDADIIRQFLQYRTYHGCAMPLPVAHASQLAWQDEQHVADNRERYRQKFAAVQQILSPVFSCPMPDASFYLWLPTPIDDQLFAQRLLQEQNLAVLPGSFLGREVNGHNPGQGFVRIALVASLDECVAGAHRLAQFGGQF